MRRLDQALEATKQTVLDKVADLERRGIENMERPLRGVAGVQFFNKSPAPSTTALLSCINDAFPKASATRTHRGSFGRPL
jgi:hypothetical protein